MTIYYLSSSALDHTSSTSSGVTSGITAVRLTNSRTLSLSLYLSPNALSIVEEAVFYSGMCECSLCGITGICLEVGEECLWC